MVDQFEFIGLEGLIDEIDSTIIEEANSYLKQLFPICRSITGNGVRQSLKILQEIADFNIEEIPSGTKCYDWSIPDEWNIKDAYIKDASGKKIVNFQECNVHIASYSMPVEKKFKFSELEGHLYTLPEMPKAIPYRTSYYNRDWGFCLSHEQFESMDKNGEYYVKIDTNLEPGSLTYGECCVEGASEEEYLISSYCCHPSLGNDNLSGMLLWAFLLRAIKRFKPRNSYRFVIAPETIGAIAYISKNQDVLEKVKGGFILTTVAGPGEFGYKPTFLKDHLLDKIVKMTFDDLEIEHKNYPFQIGSDERHYSAPGLRIPVGTITKGKYYEYDYYHTSLDNLEFINADNLIDTYKVYLSIFDKLERNATFKSLCPYCEPNLGKRGLYPKVGGPSRAKNPALFETNVICWLMFYCDGKTSLLEVSAKTGIKIEQLFKMAIKLCQLNLLKEVLKR